MFRPFCLSTLLLKNYYIYVEHIIDDFHVELASLYSDGSILYRYYLCVLFIYKVFFFVHTFSDNIPDICSVISRKDKKIGKFSILNHYEILYVRILKIRMYFRLHQLT